jgi:hypothetical protein
MGAGLAGEVFGREGCGGEGVEEFVLYGCADDEGRGETPAHLHDAFWGEGLGVGGGCCLHARNPFVKVWMISGYN